MENQTIENLNELREDILDFGKICKKYHKGHNHYKEKLKHLKLKINRFFKINCFSEEINRLINEFIEDKNKNLKKCKQIVDDLDEKIQNLEIELETKKENFSERIYDKKSAFKFHLDIKEILEKAIKEIFIIEPFVDDHILEITLKDVAQNLKIDILTNSRNADKRKKFDKLANLFKNDIDGFEVRETENLHDRGFFIDNLEGWVMGQSVKDAAKKKPTYLIQLQNPKKLKEIYRKIWRQSKKVK